MLKSVLASSAALAAALSFAPEAAAFDCAKASSDTEKAICANAELKAADDAMSAAYGVLMQALDSEQGAMLKASQTAWLKQRESNCGWQDTPEERTACLLDMTARRTNYFLAAPDGGPGLGAEAQLVPYMKTRAFGGGHCAADVSLYRFGGDVDTDGAIFNEWVDQLAASLESDYGSYAEGDLSEGMQCDYGATGTLTYASPDIVAMSVVISMFGGGAHGNVTGTAITLDRRARKALTFADIFPETARAPLTAICAEGIKAEKRLRFADYYEDKAAVETQVAEDIANYATAIEQGVGDLTNWLVYEDRAVVFFPPYELGSYAEGTYECTLPKADLQKAAGEKGWIIP